MQLLGIYPVGNFVKLNTGEVGVVRQVHAPDPYRPQVRVLFDKDGAAITTPYDLNLWDAVAEAGVPSAVVAPLDPADYPIDPSTQV